jgi:hypothetical protein
MKDEDVFLITFVVSAIGFLGCLFGLILIFGP